jgi:ArsR family transcriptional regulator
MSNEKKMSEMEMFFLALADKTRLRLLNLLREDEICVGSLVEVLNESQPKISRHLAYMRSAGIVETRRDGKWIHYKICRPADALAAQVLRDALIWLDSQERMRDEYEKLKIISKAIDDPMDKNFANQSQIYVSPNMNNKQKRELDTFLL